MTALLFLIRHVPYHETAVAVRADDASIVGGEGNRRHPAAVLGTVGNEIPRVEVPKPNCVVVPTRGHKAAVA